MTVYGFQERDDAENLKTFIRSGGGGTGPSKTRIQEYLVITPTGGIASGDTEDCEVHDSDWNGLGWTVAVKNPWTAAIEADVKMLVGPESAQGVIIPKAVDCGA